MAAAVAPAIEEAPGGRPTEALGQARRTARWQPSRRVLAVGGAGAAVTVAALALRPPARGRRTTAGAGFLAACAASVRRPPAPRPLPWVVVKRRSPRLRDGYGHWWVELDGVESYGWWPSPCPVRLPGLLRGTGGVLNGDAGGRRRRDPKHGEPADHELHPVLVARRSDWQVRRDIRRFAREFEGGWRWTVRRPAANCRSFQLALLAAAALVEDDRSRSSRGRGCWFLAPLRAARCRLRGRARGVGARHRLGGDCGCPPLRIPPL